MVFGVAAMVELFSLSTRLPRPPQSASDLVCVSQKTRYFTGCSLISRPRDLLHEHAVFFASRVVILALIVHIYLQEICLNYRGHQ